MMYRTWTKEKSNAIVQLQEEGKTHKEIGAIIGMDRHAVTGKLWRIKVKNGYVVPKNSLLSKKRNTRRTPDSDADVIGERLCNVCQQNFSYTSRYQRFCWPCKSKISHDGYSKYII
jgi:hypothetical protein